MLLDPQKFNLIIQGWDHVGARNIRIYLYESKKCAPRGIFVAFYA